MATTSIITTSVQQTIIEHIISTMSEYDKKMLRDPPYKLHLSIDKLLAPAKRTRKNKKDLNSPRQQNKFIIFRKDFEAKLRLLNPNATYKFQDISKKCGAEWRLQPSEVKKYFDLLQRIAFKKHKFMYPNYKYSPKNVSREDNDEFYNIDNYNDNCAVSNPSSIDVSPSSSSNSTTMDLAESRTFFDFSLPQSPQCTSIDMSFARHGLMPFITASSLTQDPITIPKDLSVNFDTSVASLSSLSSSNGLNSDYNNFFDGLGITTNNNDRDLTFDSSDTFNEILSLGDLDVSQTHNPLNCGEHNYLFVKTNSIDTIPIDKFVFADPKESFESNINDNNPITNINNNLNPSLLNSFTIITTTNTLTTTTEPSIVLNTSLNFSPPPQSPFSPEYLNYDSTFSAGDLSKIIFNDLLFDKFA
ncbi:5571_t:CDS:1 [Ambispora gerdemannii]|uniref:5571_t:CDS:1 n=1 Tax=Ambispora gerdemannii TaxID=144530 RepID=A0A9N9GWY7_9GLOM|nr:5571_t:CDS:1 [Ambispora gerdemannii]